jgi:hypothetical protein
LIAWCWDTADNTGDARYCGIARTLTPIASAFDDRDEAGGVDLDLAAIDAVIRTRLPSVIQESDVEAAASLARAMRHEIFSLLVTRL